MALAGIYVVGGWLGGNSGVLGGSLTLVWPPAGIALGAILLFGYKYLPGVALGALVVASMVSSSGGFSLGSTIGFALGTVAGSCAGAAVCAYLLQRLAGFRSQMDRVRDVAGLACAGAVMGTTVNAAFTALSLCFDGRVKWDQFSETWTLWWVPNCMAILVISPFILSLGQQNGLCVGLAAENGGAGLRGLFGGLDPGFVQLLGGAGRAELSAGLPPLPVFDLALAPFWTTRRDDGNASGLGPGNSRLSP